MLLGGVRPPTFEALVNAVAFFAVFAAFSVVVPTDLVVRYLVEGGLKGQVSEVCSRE